MKSRIPSDAFEYYVSLGAARSYEAVANKYDASKTAVVNLANREDWQGRLLRVERDAQQRGEARAVESIQGMNDRHLRVMQVIQKKALEALKSMSLDTAIEAVRALDIAVRQERLIRGEPSERTELTTESIIRREFATWMREEPGPDEEADADNAPRGEADVEADPSVAEAGGTEEVGA